LAVERLTGLSLSRLMQRNAFEPCGMHSSSVDWNITQWWKAASGHFKNGKSRRNRINWFPSAAGSLQTTATEYANFMQEISTSIGHEHHLSSELKKEMLKPHVRIADELSWGLGWGLEAGIQNPESTRAFWHWGDQDIFKSFALMDTINRTGIVI